jgi:hypothetical protein
MVMKNATIDKIASLIGCTGMTCILVSIPLAIAMDWRWLCLGLAWFVFLMAVQPSNLYDWFGEGQPSVTDV